jgi:hypothetical protein
MDTTYAPLENLVISQLAAIRQHEAALQQQIRGTTQSNAIAVEVQLMSLQQRADRLNRMIDAMGVSSVYSTAPAIA